MHLSAADLVRQARIRAGLNQRGLAQRAATAQSVVARIERGQTSPSWETLARLLEAAGFGIDVELGLPKAAIVGLMDDTPRILALGPADRLRELRNADRFVASAHRV